MSHTTKNYLPGLNTFRFFAALLVILSHGQQSLSKLNIYNGKVASILQRGRDGVEFFFVLSGFLITYLLVNEIQKTKNVSIKAFYLRRVFRIWPLYFLLITIGLLVLGICYPMLYHKPYFEFPIWKWLVLFICFLPNLATTLYPMGLLYPLWSIGVEEQFYLFWAPLIKIFRKKVFVVILLFITFSSGWQLIIERNLFHFDTIWVKFFVFQKFYAMAIGSFFGYLLYRYKELYQKTIFSRIVIQFVVFIAILLHLFIDLPYSNLFLYRFFLALLYGLLIMNTVSTKKSILNFEKKPFIYLGTISYGLYMYHMTIDYLLRSIVGKLSLTGYNVYLVSVGYHFFLLLFTIALAAFSFKYFESYFLKLKDKYSL